MPPRRRAPAGPTPVEATKHRDKRANIPTADAAMAYGEPDDLPQVTIDRDPALDPQLVWRGKAMDPLAADAPPIYQQEKIDARVLIENLRKAAPQQADLFASFDGLDELSQIEFYRHAANWSNRMVLGDSLQVMASLVERENLRGQVQMIYIDPPYGIKFGSNWQSRVGSRDVKDGKVDDVAREAEQIKAFRDTWELGIHSYLSYLRDRLVMARELLTESGSCFVQIGDENVHLVRSLMDEVFGSQNFVGMFPFKTTSGATTDFVGGIVDYVLWYGQNRDRTKFRPLFHPRRLGSAGDQTYAFVERSDGERGRLSKSELSAPDEVRGRVYRLQILTSQAQGRAKGDGAASWFPVEINGRTYKPSLQARWKTNELGMQRLITARRVENSANSLSYVRFHDDFPAIPLNNLWDDTQSGSGMDKVYVVQTNVRVIERCMLMCTDPGDLVLDPTCGSGTTAFVAEQWGRRWITIDTSRVALTLARQRLMGARYPYYRMTDPSDIRQGFDYETVQHITLKSIANNPDIKEGMSRAAIDEAIKRHADFETLYDRPKEDKSRVRVTGPFTVESLSPHRSLSFAAGPAEPASEHAAAVDAESPNFEQSILENLRKAGVQNGRRGERIDFASLDPYAGVYVQAVGEQVGASDDAPSRVGIAIGPQYGTVSPSFIKSAAKEAIAADDIDLLCVLGFAFDAQAGEVTEVDGVNIQATDQGFASVADERRLGRLKVLLVRMNIDLLMGDALKKTGAGNLFTVFGEPDISIDERGEQLVVTVHGVDVYDPTTGEVRSDDASQIALWMIDTDYNDEAFFVRRCYFTGANDPYKRLKTALRSDIDADAWQTLYRTESQPFDRPTTGKIAVKVINDYGDEVVKVFEV